MKHIFWLWIPLALAILQVTLEVALPNDVLSNMMSEDGPHEALQFLIAFLGFIVAAKILWQQKPWKISPYLGVWVGIACLACLYIAGEEVSWGQHILEWETSEYWHQINDQNETNLHNTSSWLDQKPRIILLLGIFVGGIIIPLLQRYKPSALPKKFEIIYPPATLSVTAILAILLLIIDKVDDAMPQVLMERSSEVQEVYMFYFVLLYLVWFEKKLKTLKA